MFVVKKVSHGGQGIQERVVIWGVLGWFCLLNVSALGEFSGGSGTLADPYLISSATDLKTLGQNSVHWDKHFRLTADLNLIGGDMVPIGNSESCFTGTFNGGGHIIANLKINMSRAINVGLFGCVSNMDDPNTIVNLGLVNADITGNKYVGGLVGRNNSSGTISNCYVTGSVNGLHSVGGLLGYKGVGNISNCYATGTVTGGSYTGGLVGNSISGTISNCYSTGKVTGNGASVGGFVGKNNSGTISNCYVTSPVKGFRFVGGLVGWNDYGTISNCYATGTVNGSEMAGGLVGKAVRGTMSNSFWNTETSRQASSAGGTGKTTDELKMIATFAGAGWDFAGEIANGINDFWWLRSDGVYPRLTWEMQN